MAWFSQVGTQHTGMSLATMSSAIQTLAYTSQVIHASFKTMAESLRKDSKLSPTDVFMRSSGRLANEHQKNGVTRDGFSVSSEVSGKSKNLYGSTPSATSENDGPTKDAKDKDEVNK